MAAYADLLLGMRATEGVSSKPVVVVERTENETKEQVFDRSMKVGGSHYGANPQYAFFVLNPAPPSLTNLVTRHSQDRVLDPRLETSSDPEYVLLKTHGELYHSNFLLIRPMLSIATGARKGVATCGLETMDLKKGTSFDFIRESTPLQIFPPLMKIHQSPLPTSSSAGTRSSTESGRPAETTTPDGWRDATTALRLRSLVRSSLLDEIAV